MSKITRNQIEAIYKVSKDVYLDEIEFNKAIKVLNEKHLVNSTYASIFIANLRCLLLGNIFKRTMKASAFDYYLSQIIKDFGHEGISNSLTALKQHIEYLESHYKSRKNRLREILGKFEKESVKGIELSDFHLDFEQQVQRSLNLTQKERIERIKQAKKLPSIKTIQVKVFSRNPDIVAERLKLTNGICDSCKQPAPFIKSKDLTPYLEVHHIKQLANGGEDTLENTEALCPNCHRQKHFGFT